MKKCPICHSNCFDDMKTCFVCLHRFDSPLGKEERLKEGEQQGLSVLLPREITSGGVPQKEQGLKEETRVFGIPQEAESAPCIRIEIPLQMFAGVLQGGNLLAGHAGVAGNYSTMVPKSFSASI